MAEHPTRSMKAILARTTADRIKSRILSPELCELVFEVYMTPEQYADLISRYFNDQFTLEVHD